MATSDRPALAEVTGRWRWEAFFRHRGEALGDRLATERADAATAAVMPRTLVLVVGGEPVGMASLVSHDLDERPDLPPWLAGVFVAPHARGRGHAARLVGAVERMAAEAAVGTLWLYTGGAERLYARMGWRTVETFGQDGKAHALMRRDLVPLGVDAAPADGP